jgi:hypothetical protein
MVLLTTIQNCRAQVGTLLACQWRFGARALLATRTIHLAFSVFVVQHNPVVGDKLRAHLIRNLYALAYSGIVDDIRYCSDKRIGLQRPTRKEEEAELRICSRSERL